MATFSWSDNFKIAFRSCSRCLLPLQDDDELSVRQDEDNSFTSRRSLTSTDQLHGLLANSDTDGEAERMSLHSNPGRGSQRKKTSRRRSKKTSTDNSHRITLFGYNLFGRPRIQLADDSEDALYYRRGTTTPNTHSTVSSILDADAASLDTDTIAALSSPTAAAAAIKAASQASAEVEAQRLKEKEERRRRRREKKEMKRVAELLARQGSVGDGEFEGFQGSGAESTRPREQPNVVSEPPRDEHDDDDDADLDGSHYARNTSGGSNEGSDSRSRISSDRMHPPSELSAMTTNSRKKKSKATNSSQTTKSSSSTTSQPSLRQVISPSTVEQGQGYFDLEDVSVQKSDPGYLPITGFGGTPANSRMASSLGAILAQRGNEITNRG